MVFSLKELYVALAVSYVGQNNPHSVLEAVFRSTLLRARNRLNTRRWTEKQVVGTKVWVN